jgi:hypothetical protein
MLLYRRLLIIFLSLLGLLFLSIVLINYYIDGANYFFQSKNFERKLATQLLNNNNVLVCTNYNDRSLKRTLLQQLSKRPRILIFGSSRSMPISHELFNEHSFFNASVSSARLEDDMALYAIYARRGWKPDVVIIELSQWILDKSDVMLMWKTTFLSEYYAAKQAAYNHATPIKLKDKLGGLWEKYSQLLSLSYFKNSLKKLNLTHQLIHNSLPLDSIVTRPNTTDLSAFPTCYLQYPNGTRATAQTDEAVSPTQADFVSLQDLKHPWPTTIDIDYQDLFEHFIRYLINQNVQVIFYLPPYEPKAYAEFQKNPAYKIENITEQYFLKLAEQYHLAVIGSYNPTKLHLSSSDFFDYTHLKAHAFKKIFDSEKFDQSLLSSNAHHQ